MNHSEHDRNRKQRPKPHKDWRLWFVVGLMLLSMIAYVMTMDDSWRPSGFSQDRAPVGAEAE